MKKYGYKTGQISNSMLQLAVECPWRYSVEFEHGYRPRTESYFVLGTLVHQVCSDYYDNPAQFESLASKISCLDSHILEWLGGDVGLTAYLKSVVAFMQSAEAEICLKKALKLPRGCKEWQENIAPFLDDVGGLMLNELSAAASDVNFNTSWAQMYETMLRCVVNFQRYVDYQYDKNIVRIQSELVIEPQTILDFDITGTIDLLEHKHGFYSVYDFKTGQYFWDTADVVNSDQLLLYATLCRNSLGQLPEFIGIVDLFNGEIVRSVVTDEMLAVYHNRYKAFIEHLKHVKGNPMSMPGPAGKKLSFSTCRTCPLSNPKTPEEYRCPYRIWMGDMNKGYERIKFGGGKTI